MNTTTVTAKTRVVGVLKDGALNSLIGVTGMVGVAGAMVVTSTSLFLSDAVRVSPLMIGLFFAARAASEILSDLVVGALSDRMSSRRSLLALCAACSAAGAVGYLLLRDYYALLMTGALFFGIGGAVFSQLFAYTREFADSRGTDAAFFNSALRSVTSVAWIVGPPFGFYLISSRGFSSLFFAAAVFYLLSAALCALALPDTGKTRPTAVAEAGRADGTVEGLPESAAGDTAAGTERTARTAPEKTAAPAAPAPPRNAFSGLTPRVRSLMAVIVLMLTVNSIYQINIALFVTKDLGLGKGFAGLLLGLAAALEIPLMIYTGAKAERIGKWRLVTVAAVCATLFFAALPFTESPVALLLLQVPNALWTAIVLSIPVIILQNAMSDRIGAASALYGASFKAGSFLGGMTAGAVAQWLGFTHVFWACAVLSAVAALLLVTGGTDE
ncbi:MFS transporter [Streptomyces sp. WAC 00631]|uniref:MFS transporter n=1 Tax=Streptomyces sp. WAC 00631 TaxID=2203201 RepID=UPI000F7A6AD3|nr:MFS transporter [Streptomyces sp. WAC 00631]MCC5033821.1 MFS transporter [Streptomyces sp. WAC 00631]